MKNKKTLLQSIAMFCIKLILILPIYSAIVFADLSNIQAKGSDGINNYIKENDFITFKATASVSGDSQITPNQVLLGTTNFDSCTQGVNGFECTLRYPSNGTTIFDQRSIPYTINLKNDGGSVIDTKTNVLFVDNLKPQITSFETQSALINKGDIEFKFSIIDKACDVTIDSACQGKCSGISKIELFTLDGSFSETKDINTASCSLTGNLTKPSTVFGDGQHAVFAKAFDRLNRPSDVISTIFEIDNTPPEILANTFKITDNSGFEIKHVAPTDIEVLAVVNIGADDLNESSVFGDFSALNPTASQQNVKAECSDTEENLTTCVWNIKIKSDEAGTKSFELRASDLAGNKEVISIPLDFEVDSIGPEVTSLSSARTKDGKSFVKPTGNTFIAEFKEDGVGIKKEDALLHIENKVIKAANCSPSWICRWDNVDVSSRGTVTFSIEVDTKDRLGNSLAAPFSAEAVVDTKAPVVVNVSISNIGGAQAEIQNFSKTGDSLNIIALVRDESIEGAVADVSSVVQDAENLNADSCINIQGDSWLCSWTTAPIDITGSIDSFIFLTFTDVAGNTIQHKEPIKVFGLFNDTSPNLWKYTVSCSPKLIDRQTTALISQRVFCHVNLEPLLQQDIEPLIIGLDGCGGNQSGAFDAVDLLNAEQGSKDPFIRLALKQTDFNINEINAECPVSIISRVRDEITTTPEVENILINLSFFNLPVGELEESVQKKIDDAVEDATQTLWDIIGGLKKIELYARRLCQIVNAIQNVIAIFKGVGFLVAGKAEASKATPAYPAVSTYRKFLDVVTEAQREGGLNSFTIVKKSCQFVNCGLTSEDFAKWGFTKWIGDWKDLGESAINTLDVGNIVSNYVGRGGKVAPASSYMNPKDSMVVAVLTACIPGIIHGLDKYRQIQCMYANCLQEGVGQQGLPVFACEDQKDYATCKYITGEIFKVIPITAMFDYYLKLIRNTLVNPLSVIGVIPGYVCQSAIASENNYQYHFCAVTKVIAMVGETAQEVTSIIDEGFKLRDDFCKRLEENND